jgi:hypothetical protein
MEFQCSAPYIRMFSTQQQFPLTPPLSSMGETMSTQLRCLTFVLLAGLLSATALPQVRVYVSLSGDDRWSGSLAAPRSDQSDGPVRSLERAIQILQSARKLHGPRPGIIALRGGVYRLKAGIRFDTQDSNTTVQPYRNEQVILTGSMPLERFRPLGPAADRRIPPRLRDSITTVDLPAIGITDFGTITPRSSPGLELFLGGKRMPLARWPNEGWLRILDVPQTGDSCLHQGLAREKRFNGIPAGRHYGRITYAEEKPNRWLPDTNIYLHGYWTFDWSDAFQKVGSIDTLHREFRLSPPYHGYGYTKNQRYYAVNVLEELDRPGEWYLDRGNGLLYFWQPTPMPDQIPAASILDQPFFTLDSVSHVTLDHFVMTEARGGAVLIRGGDRNLVRNCTLTNLGGEAVRIEGGSAHGVKSCEMSGLALGGITLLGGDRKSLSAAHHFVINCHIHHFSEWIRTGQYAIVLDGVGSTAAHNEIHDAPFEALTLRGNDHLIEYNNIYRVTQECGDAGAFHTGRNWTWQGNVIRYNYFHDLQGPGLHGVMGVYLDDWASGFTVRGNVFYKAGRATLIGGGRNNTVENNIYINCTPSIHVDARGLGWAGYYFDGTRTELFDQMKEVAYDKPPYSTRYPQLLTMYDGETQVPKYNVIRNNVSWGGRWMDVYDYQAFDLSVVKIVGNVIADPNVLRRREAGHKDWDPYYLDIDMKEGYELLNRSNPEVRVIFKGNRFVESACGSIDTTTGAVEILPALLPRGWKPIPFGRIGRLPDRHVR